MNRALPGTALSCHLPPSVPETRLSPTICSAGGFSGVSRLEGLERSPTSSWPNCQRGRGASVFLNLQPSATRTWNGSHAFQWLQKFSADDDDIVVRIRHDQSSYRNVLFFRRVSTAGSRPGSRWKTLDDSGYPACQLRR